MRIDPGFRCRAALLTSALAWSASACGTPPEPEHVLRPVRYETVSSSRATRVRTFAGVARAGQESRLSFRVSGTVVSVPAVVGETVRRGDALAKLDPTDYELKVQEALAGLAQAEAAARNAEADYDRVRGLYENNNASLRELDGARANSESSQAQVEAARKRLEQARQQLSYCTLEAPADGTVASADVEVNENIGAGQTLFLLTAGGETDVEVSLPEALISEVRLGQPAEVRFGALSGRRFEAVVAEAAATSIGTATTFPVKVRLRQSDPDIRSGMAAEVTFRFEPGSSARHQLVPSVAVGEDRSGRFVFVLEKTGDGAGVVHRTPVKVGELVGDRLEVLDGLSDGELIVTAGVRRLLDGQEVAVLEPSP